MTCHCVSLAVVDDHRLMSRAGVTSTKGKTGDEPTLSTRSRISHAPTCYPNTSVHDAVVSG